MGYFGKIELKEKAQRLRKNGLSYNEIRETIKVSKDTLSRWCKDIELTDGQKSRLIANKKHGQKKGSLVAAENKRKFRIENTKRIQEFAKKEIGNTSKRDNFIFGLALYAGEGGKTDGRGTFTNSNPYFVKFMTRWFQDYCNLTVKDLKGSIWLHEENNEIRAKKFWSILTGIPLNNFHKTYIVKLKEGVSYRKNIHEYGIFSLKFYNSDLQRKILGWISVFLGDKIANTQEIENIPR